MPDFIPGLKLAELFYREAVKPILDIEYPDLVYSAALIGSGSEILGYDTAQSTDHHWGPRLMIFLSEADYQKRQAISDVLSNRLPHSFYGYPTSFGTPDEIGVRLLTPTDSGPVQHRVEFDTVGRFFTSYLGIDPRGEITTANWLSTPEQKLLTITAGQVYHDGLGELEAIRSKLAYYPDQVWRYVLACQWQRIAEEEPFVGRCGDVGDELGSRVIAARLVHDLMKLCFIMERRYAPYSKWFGTAFARLTIAAELTPIFHQIFAAVTWKEREGYLSRAYEIVARQHNALHITPPKPEQVSNFFNRPYLVIHAGEFAAAIHSTITDPALCDLPLVGAIDQYVDNTLVLSRVMQG